MERGWEVLHCCSDPETVISDEEVGSLVVFAKEEAEKDATFLTMLIGSIWIK